MRLIGGTTILTIVMMVGSTVAFQIPQPRRTLSSPSSSSSLGMTLSKVKKIPGTADLDGVAWGDLGFEFRPTNSHLRIFYREGPEGAEWGKPELVKEPYINLHMAATSLHYGQSCFEGLKAFCHEDGEVYVFRPDENAARMQSSCRRILMPELPTELFLKAINKVVVDNLEYVPPYGSGGSLYIRPLLFGSGPRIGLQPAAEYQFIIMVIPVGDYYHGGLSKPVDAVIVEDYDRAAPRGVGSVKVAGNYAADLLPNMKSKEKGFPISLYLDAATQTKVEEFSTSNFVGIDRKRKLYVTPKSPSVLPSITNKSLMQLAAQDLGFTVEERDIPVEELKNFDEVLAVGTAVVVTPVGSVTRLDANGNVAKKYTFGDNQDEVGEMTLRLYNHMIAIQNGQADDNNGWNLKINQ